MKSLLIVMTLFYISSCVNREKEVLELTLVYQTDSIKIDVPYLSDYQKSSLSCRNDQILFYGYNRFLHSIDVLNLSSLSEVCSYELEKEGPRGVLNVMCFKEYQDKFIIQTMRDFLVYDPESGILKKYGNTDLLNNTYTTQVFGVSAGNYMYFECADDQLYFNARPRSYLNDSTFYLKPTAIQLDINTGEVSLMDIPYPVELRDGLDFYASMADIQITRIKNKLVYNFPYSSKIYVYDLESGSRKEYIGEVGMSKKAPACGLAKNEKNAWQHMIYDMCALRYSPIYYHSSISKYSRIRYHKRESMKEQREYDIELFDKDFNLIAKYNIPFRFTSYNKTDDGLIFVVYTLATADEWFKFANVKF